MGDRHHQSLEDASDRGASLSRRRGLALALVLAALAALWGAGGASLGRRLDEREEAVLAALAAGARARLGEDEALVRREATLLAQDASVIEGAEARDVVAALLFGAWIGDPQKAFDLALRAALVDVVAGDICDLAAEVARARIDRDRVVATAENDDAGKTG